MFRFVVLIRCVFGWEDEVFDWNLLTQIFQAAKLKEIIISFENIVTEDMAILIGQWNIKFNLVDFY